MWKLRHVLRNADEGGDGGGAAAPSPAPASPAPAPAAASPAAASPAPVQSPAAAPSPAEPKGNEGYWPADWRQTVSKADAKILSRLERYQSPEAAMHALIAAQNKISSGELKPVLGKNASAEEIADYRKAMGIPEAPDKYDLGKDVTLDESDQATAAELFKAAHASNQTPEQVKATLKALHTAQQNAAASVFEADKAQAVAGEEALRTEWGPEFRRNINLIHGMLDGTTDQKLKDSFLNGRLADGTRIGSSPEALKLLASLALIQNPAGIVVPGQDANPMQGVTDEIAKIDKFMREDRQAYNKDEKMQARYRELLEAREKLQPRGKAA